MFTLNQNRIDELGSWRSELVSELAELKSQITKSQQVIELKESQLKNVISLLQTETALDSSKHSGQDSSPIGFLDAAYELLQSSRDHIPLHYKTIVDSIVECGVYVPGENPYANLLTNISRDRSRFQRVGRGMYALTEWGMTIPRKKAKSKTQKTAKK